MGKVSKNLSLDQDAVERGERYSRKHGTNVSRLVTDFLRRLPEDGAGTVWSPAVDRLLGIAASAARAPGKSEYDEHLWKRHGGPRLKRRAGQ